MLLVNRKVDLVHNDSKANREDVARMISELTLKVCYWEFWMLNLKITFELSESIIIIMIRGRFNI